MAGPPSNLEVDNLHRQPCFAHSGPFFSSQTAIFSQNRHLRSQFGGKKKNCVLFKFRDQVVGMGYRLWASSRWATVQKSFCSNQLVAHQPLRPNVNTLTSLIPTSIDYCIFRTLLEVTRVTPITQMPNGSTIISDFLEIPRFSQSNLKIVVKILRLITTRLSIGANRRVVNKVPARHE